MDTVLLLVAAFAFICEYLNASLGMGYGTTLAPLLLLLGFQPLQVVPAVLLGQLASGFFGGFAHHKLGNIHLDFRRDEEICRRLRFLGYIPKSHDSKVIFILAICGIVGALTAVFFALNIPEVILKVYIGAIVAATGIFILIKRGKTHNFSWKKLFLIGLISSFNKGVSGGGYGPLVTGGQILSGSSARSAVGATAVSETFVCVVAFIAYLAFKGDIFWKLAVATTVGSVAAAPLSAFTVRKISSENLKIAIGVATILLGSSILAKIVV